MNDVQCEWVTHEHPDAKDLKGVGGPSLLSSRNWGKETERRAL